MVKDLVQPDTIPSSISAPAEGVIAFGFLSMCVWVSINDVLCKNLRPDIIDHNDFVDCSDCLSYSCCVCFQVIYKLRANVRVLSCNELTYGVLIPGLLYD
jgi:hypothetical protein